MDRDAMITDTIAAISTAPGAGFRAVVRMSGPEAFAVAFRLLIDAPPSSQWKGFSMPRVRLALPEGGRCDARMLIMRAPLSYTREDMVELHIPGAPALAELILASCLEKGASRAGPGAFTRRAYLKGRIDASQVEGVLAMVESRSDEEHKAALHLLRGGSLREAGEVRSHLLHVLAGIEAYLDFTEDDTEAVDRVALKEILALCLERLKRMGARLDRRIPYRNLPRVVILGPPNAGKSSLFRSLVPTARALTSPVPGTTRDLLEGEVKGLDREFLLYDAPGVAPSRNPLEKMALSHLSAMMARMDAALILFDGSRSPQPDDHARVTRLCASLPHVIALNKSDLPRHAGWKKIQDSASWPEISTYGHSSLQDLTAALVRQLPLPAGQGIMGMDHQTRAVIAQAEQAIQEALEIDWEGGLELVALEIREATESMGLLAGRITNEEVLDQVFSRFCIGK